MIAAAEFAAWVRRYEGTVPHLYLDTKGLVTTGVGNLVDPVALALSLPFLRPDGGAASKAEIRYDWTRVKSMPRGMLAYRYATFGALRLSTAGIDALVARQHGANVKQLLRSYPELDDYPEPAQCAILGMAWAMGAGFPSRWPRFSAAVRERDWAAAAAESKISNANADRNKAHQDLLLAAAAMEQAA